MVSVEPAGIPVTVASMDQSERLQNQKTASIGSFQFCFLHVPLVEPAFLDYNKACQTWVDLVVKINAPGHEK